MKFIRVLKAFELNEEQNNIVLKTLEKIKNIVFYKNTLEQMFDDDNILENDFSDIFNTIKIKCGELKRVTLNYDIFKRSSKLQNKKLANIDEYEDDIYYSNDNDEDVWSIIGNIIDKIESLNESYNELYNYNKLELNKKEQDYEGMIFNIKEESEEIITLINKYNNFIN